MALPRLSLLLHLHLNIHQIYHSLFRDNNQLFSTLHSMLSQRDSGKGSKQVLPALSHATHLSHSRPTHCVRSPDCPALLLLCRSNIMLMLRRAMKQFWRPSWIFPFLRKKSSNSQNVILAPWYVHDM